MHHVIRAADISKASDRTRKFEGGAYGAGISFFAVDLGPGEGPDMHLHPYSETWLVLSGTAEFEVEEETLLAFPGDVVIVPPQTPHRFTNRGERSLTMVCIHHSGRIVQQFPGEQLSGNSPESC